ncbi:hypothetical protein ACFLZG_02080 [Thermodesulfobacteriota bacterium]
MHVIKGICVNVVKEETDPKDGREKQEYQVLQVIRKGNFIHQIKGVVQDVKEVTDRGILMNGISLMTNGGRYMKIEKILDEDTERKYPIGKEIEVFAVPEIRDNGGRPEVFFRVTDPDQEIEGNTILKSIKDWSNEKWPLNKELSLKVRYRAYLGKKYNDLGYTINSERPTGEI